jgi:hypothetical protein
MSAMSPREPVRPRQRRGFDLLFTELSVAVGSLVPRYPLWLRLHALGYDPERLDRASVLAFCGEQLESFLFEYGVYLPKRELERVRRRISSFDPAVPTAYERMAALSD